MFWTREIIAIITETAGVHVLDSYPDDLNCTFSVIMDLCGWEKLLMCSRIK